LSPQLLSPQRAFLLAERLPAARRLPQLATTVPYIPASQLELVTSYAVFLSITAKTTSRDTVAPGAMTPIATAV